MTSLSDEKRAQRRSFLRDVMRGTLLLLSGFFAGLLPRRVQAEESRWQIDPHKCTACGRCADHCVLDLSAVKAVHSYSACGYCRLCTAFFVLDPYELDEGAENQLCPAGAIIRDFVEKPYYEYHIDEDLCVACGRCVAGCDKFGNGSMYLQIRHDRCRNCNECSIARHCPANAIERVSIDRAYIDKFAEGQSS